MLEVRPHLYIFNREALVFVPSDLMITTFLSSLLFNRYLLLTHSGLVALRVFKIRNVKLPQATP